MYGIAHESNWIVLLYEKLGPEISPYVKTLSTSLKNLTPIKRNEEERKSLYIDNLSTSLKNRPP